MCACGFPSHLFLVPSSNYLSNSIFSTFEFLFEQNIQFFFQFHLWRNKVQFAWKFRLGKSFSQCKKSFVTSKFKMCHRTTRALSKIDIQNTIFCIEVVFVIEWFLFLIWFFISFRGFIVVVQWYYLLKYYRSSYYGKHFYGKLTSDAVIQIIIMINYIPNTTPY